MRCQTVLPSYSYAFKIEHSKVPTLVSRISVQARISVQGGILLKILKKEYRVKTGYFIHDKRDFVYSFNV